MFNLRYHIASLVAVFLALAVGLLLGGIVVERGTLDRQRDTIVKSLQADFERLNSENHELSAEVDRLSSFSEGMLPSLLSGELQGRQILVLVDPSRRDVSKAVSDALRQAGALPVVMHVRVPEFGLDDPEHAAALPDLPAAGRAARLEAFSAALAHEWSSSGIRPVTMRLRDAGILDGDDLPSLPFSGLVIATSWSAGDAAPVADEACIAIGERMERLGAVVVAAETSAQDIGCVSAATAKALSAVDDVDEPEGAFSLVRILAGKAEGHFGTRPGADAPFPKP